MLACMKSLMCLVQNKEKRNKELEEYLIEHGTQAAEEAPLEHAVFDKLVAGSWVQFVKCGLRAHYCNPRFLDWLCHLVVVICNDLGKTSEVAKSLSLTTLHQMILSHSQFLRIMLAEAEAEKSDKTRKDSEVKGSLVKLLLTIVQGDRQCCQTSHLTVLFGAYGATLSETDQRLLNLLQLYEASGCKMQDYRPYMWGPEAVERYTVRRNLGPSLWQEPTMDQVVGLLEPELLWQTVLHFPLRRSLKVANTESFTAADKLGSLPRCYDPCFLMPLFSHLVAPDRLVNCRKFVEQGCLSVTLAALSSHDPAMRGAACYVLHQLSLHLETERRFPERLQVTYLLECVRNSLETENLKFACVISVFLAKAARLMLKWAYFELDRSSEKSASSVINFAPDITEEKDVRLTSRSTASWFIVSKTCQIDTVGVEIVVHRVKTGSIDKVDIEVGVPVLICFGVREQLLLVQTSHWLS
ncbi:hypothetical protein NP493_1873g00016 [Ridgeia piscesae]|uniref:URB1 C-terminal domain-containing protein n=1 Tax=Ridgeia piscesae TaxID=27915 RepID=A0AAD9JQP2_RIDPI|nr:hypothetical protein NP493_1873g00016 [Ridgeia piscesae]